MFAASLAHTRYPFAPPARRFSPGGRTKNRVLGTQLAEPGFNPAITPDIRRLLELSWAAGFADGEACITIAKTQLKDRTKPTYRLVLTLNQNHAGSLTRFAEAVGVRPRLYKVRRTLSMNRDAYVLNICDQHAVRVLKSLLPFLERKAPEAEIALMAYDEGRFNVHPGSKGHPPHIWKIREFFYLKLQRMK